MGEESLLVGLALVTLTTAMWLAAFGLMILGICESGGQRNGAWLQVVF